MAKILIKNGKLWNGEEFSKGDVFVNGKCIEKIAPEIVEEADFIFDADGKIVSPGLIDLHVHMQGFSSTEFAVNTEVSSFPFGVTAVNDAGSIHGNKERLEQLAVKSTVFVCVDIKANHADLEDLDARIETYGERAIGLKVYFDSEISDVQDIRPLQEICEYARKRDLKVMVHCSNSPVSMQEIIHTLSRGDILTHAYHGGVNSCAEEDFVAFRIAKERGIVIDTGFAGYVHTNFQNFKHAIKAGYLPDTISTDITKYSAFKRGGRYGMTMCMSMAREAGMREADILKAVTSTPAKVLGKSKEWGYLQVGRCADIAILNEVCEPFYLQDQENNVLESNKSYRCVLTICDGQVVYRD